MLLSAAIAFLIPKEYESVARLMPPDNGGSGTAMLAALAGRSSGGLGGLSSLAGGLLGVRPTSSLFIDVLRSRTVGDYVIDRFDLQRVYRNRYRIDALKRLARSTKIVDDTKSGVITLTVTDTDAQRARAMTLAYLDELNKLVTVSDVSAARSERKFIEKRLVTVQADLQSAEKALGEFSSVHATLDVKEQTRAMVDAAGQVQAQLIVEQSGLDSLQQIYGNENVRVRSARARIAGLQSELAKLGGSSEPLPSDSGKSSSVDNSLYPSLRQLPRLAVPYTDLYRRVRIQEQVYELLSQQYEMARIEEAKDTPIVSVIDAPLVAEKKSFPPRLLIIAVLTALSIMAACFLILCDRSWRQVNADDPRKILIAQIAGDMAAQFKRANPNTRVPE